MATCDARGSLRELREGWRRQRPPEHCLDLLRFEQAAGVALRLVFLVVGPAVDVKLVAMQAGLFGRAFAQRFAPLTFLVATLIATAVGAVLL